MKSANRRRLIKALSKSGECKAIGRTIGSKTISTCKLSVINTDIYGHLNGGKLILDKIVEDKKEHIEKGKAVMSPQEMRQMAEEAIKGEKFDRRSLIEAIQVSRAQAVYTQTSQAQTMLQEIAVQAIGVPDTATEPPERVPLIAEIKRRSPSGGQMNCPYDMIELAGIYERSGAMAISILTDEKYFGGSIEDVAKVRSTVSLPILRKDFIIDEYQVYEAKAYGADLILLIAAILDDSRMGELLQLAHSLRLEVLIESHTKEELERSIATGAKLIGINNRNLDTLVTDLATSEELIPLVPDDRIVVTESGVKNGNDVKRLLDAGANAFLVGEALLKDKDPGDKVAEMVYVESHVKTTE
jgi:indole-3-glycerol phosphate synthase